MKIIIGILLLILTSFLIFPTQNLGLDSGYEEILFYSNGKKSNNVLVLIGGIHGDEKETIDVINFLKENLKSETLIYFIPTINPTLYSKAVNRRGFLSEHLDSNGYVLKGSKLQDFDKSLYYRIFYGNENTYKNGIDHFVDPNRDFIDEKLPSTRHLKEFLTSLINKNHRVTVISIHGYMSGGRVYPEYNHTENGFDIGEHSWEMAKEFATQSGYRAEKMYSPAIPIIDRFKGEFIAYTGRVSNLIGLDIELDDNRTVNNNIAVLTGVEAIMKLVTSK